MNALDKITWVLLIIGGLNWLLVGLFEFDLVAAMTGTFFGEVNPISGFIYVLVGLSALFQAVMYKRLHAGYTHEPRMR